MAVNDARALEHVTNTLTQLKEMRHYSRGNVERLSSQWLLFDGELKKLKQADRIEDLMVRAGELHEAIEAEIEALEGLAASLAPAPEGGAPEGVTRH